METSLTWLGRLATAPSGPDWRRLNDVYAPLLQSWLARAGVPTADRDDLVQEVLIVVVRRVGEFDRRGPGAFRGWLRGVLANHVRKFFRDRPIASFVDPDDLAVEDSVLARAWDREHDEHLAARALRTVEGDVAPATWQAFRRQVFEHRSPAEVATELGLSLNAVLLAKSRVLKRLRAELNGLVG
jgi:RNA polymerase sigma-70 factor (ECF subfamily)